MNIDFACTSCGKCCHDLRLPLTVSEAIAWLERGNDVQLLVELLPWPEEPPEDNLYAAHRRRRSFAAMSGTLPARVAVVLAGTHAGACPHLQADMRCGIYEERPLVCRIYPAEINPFIGLAPEHKACPPQAWTPGLPPLIKGGALVDAATLPLVQRSREADIDDVAVKQQVCALLGIDQAAVSNEGFVAYAPERRDLLAALRQASEHPVASAAAAPVWGFVSNQRATVDVLLSVGALSSLAVANGMQAFEYLAFAIAA